MSWPCDWYVDERALAACSAIIFIMFEEMNEFIFQP